MINPARFQSVLGKVNDQQLMEMLKRPDKIPTQFVVAEINRRQSMRQSAKASQMAMAQRTPVMPNQNVQRMPPQGQPMPRQQQQPQQPQRMDEGGIPLPQRKPTVGQRNFNPMNLRPISGEPFFGTVGQRNGYTIFDNDLAGLRAGFVNMNTQAGKGVDTVDDYISAYAPVGENSAASVSNYKSFVADALGVGVDDKIDLTDPATQIKVADAQIKFENRGDDDYYQSLKTMLPQAQQMSRNKKDDPFGTARRKVSTVAPSSPASSGVRPSVYQTIDDAVAKGDLATLRAFATDDSVPATYGTDVQQYAARKLGQLTASRNTSSQTTSSRFGAGPSDAMYQRYGDSIDNMGPPVNVSRGPQKSKPASPSSSLSLEDIARSQFRDRQDLPTGSEFPGPPKPRPAGSYIEDVNPGGIKSVNNDGPVIDNVGPLLNVSRGPESDGPSFYERFVQGRKFGGKDENILTGGEPALGPEGQRIYNKYFNNPPDTGFYDSDAVERQVAGAPSNASGQPDSGLTALGKAPAAGPMADGTVPDTPDYFVKMAKKVTEESGSEKLGNELSKTAADASKDRSGLGDMNLSQIGDLSFFNTNIEGLKGEQKKLLDAYNDGTADLIKRRKELMDMLETQKRTPQNMMFRALIDFGLELASSPEANFTRALAGAAKAGIASFENMTKGEQDRLYKKYKMAYDLAATEFDHKMKGQKMALDMEAQLLSVADTLSQIGYRQKQGDAAMITAQRSGNKGDGANARALFNAAIKVLDDPMMAIDNGQIPSGYIIYDNDQNPVGVDRQRFINDTAAFYGIAPDTIVTELPELPETN